MLCVALRARKLSWKETALSFHTSWVKIKPCQRRPVDRRHPGGPAAGRRRPDPGGDAAAADVRGGGRADGRSRPRRHFVGVAVRRRGALRPAGPATDGGADARGVASGARSRRGDAQPPPGGGRGGDGDGEPVAGNVRRYDELPVVCRRRISCGACDYGRSCGTRRRCGSTRNPDAMRTPTRCVARDHRGSSRTKTAARGTGWPGRSGSSPPGISDRRCG